LGSIGAISVTPVPNPDAKSYVLAKISQNQSTQKSHPTNPNQNFTEHRDPKIPEQIAIV
jgi:hypothetical protein